jgi:carboxyl-terminal processing protease
MHSRSWLSILSLPLVVAFTVPVVQQGQPPRPSSAGASGTPQDPLAGLADIQDVLSLVQQNYVDAPDMGKVVSGGIQAVLERAHPLNSYLSPEDLRLPDPGPASVGLRVVKWSIYGMVMAVTPGGPAAKAGIQVGDTIRKVNGDSVGQLSAWSLERSLRGAEGSSLDLYRNNANGDLTKTTLIRQQIPPEAISLKSGSGAVLVSLPDLATGRAVELKRLLAPLDRHQTLVVDLRTCAFGTIQEAAAVAGLLGAKGVLGSVQEAGKADKQTAVMGSEEPFGKLVLLLGRSTMGPSEVMASCLKNGGASTLGAKTPGLAVERQRFPLKQGGAVELVARRWLGLGGEKLDRQGVVPDRALKLTDTDDVLAKVLTALQTPLAVAKMAPVTAPQGGHAEDLSVQKPHH